MESIKIRSFSEIDVASIDTSTLVLLDINETLMVHTDEFRLLKNLNSQHRSAVINIIKNKFPVSGQNIIDFMFGREQMRLVDEKFHDFFTMLTNKNAHAMALTAMRPGFASKFTRFPVQDIWAKKLGNSGIKFESKYDVVFDAINEENPDYENLKIDNFDKFYKLHDAMIHRGIVYCCNINKGFILVKLLSHLENIGHEVKNIIMVDDLESNLVQMMTYLKNYDAKINFEGYNIVTEIEKEALLDPIDEKYIDDFVSNICDEFFARYD